MRIICRKEGRKIERDRGEEDEGAGESRESREEPGRGVIQINGPRLGSSFTTALRTSVAYAFVP